MNNIEKVTQLLVEFEGLLHVLSKRDNENIRQLVDNKFDALTREYKTLRDNLQSGVMPQCEIKEIEHADQVLTDIEVKNQEFVESEVEDEMDASIHAIDEETAKNAEADIELEAEEEIPEMVVEMPEEDRDESILADDDDADQPLNEKMHRFEEPEISSEMRVDQKLSSIAAIDLRRAFTINDKVMFSRVLFNHDGAKFAEVLDRLNELATFDDAKELLEKVYKMNLSSPEVEDFLSIIKPHYKS